MKPSYVICANCHFKMTGLLHTDEEVERAKERLRQRRARCPKCGGVKFIRKVAHKL